MVCDLVMFGCFRYVRAIFVLVGLCFVVDVLVYVCMFGFGVCSFGVWIFVGCLVMTLVVVFSFAGIGYLVDFTSCFCCFNLFA